VTVAFVYDGGGRCTLTGYPTVRMLAASGHRLAMTTTRYATGHPVRTVLVAHGARAYFVIHYSDGAAFQGQPGYRACPNSARLQLTPPGQTRRVTLSGKGGQITPYGRRPGACGLLFISAITGAPTLS
jgi:Protein of unknown function (DUF4232)